MSEENQIQIQVENIDHLGIIAGIVDEIGIVDIINQKLSVDERERITKGQVIGEGERKVIEISQGYSRDNRPDLKQCVLNLIVSSDGEIPVFMKPGDGNQSDKKTFSPLLKEYKKRLNLEDEDTVMVCDSALYSQENIQLMKNIDWITRVPLTINKAKKLVEEWEFNEDKNSNFGREEISEREKKLKKKGYQWMSVRENYGGVAQRWLIVESKTRKESDLKKLSQKIPKEKEKVIKEQKKLRGRLWCEEKECYREIKRVNKQLKYHELEIEEIKKRKRKKEEKIKYEAQIEIKEKAELIARKKRAAGRFILATNVMSEKKLKDGEILWNYKEQQNVERGFRFLKTPLFFADSFYVNKVERIEGILWLMSICLLVYNLGQRAVRKELKRVKKGIENQLGKKTDRVTLRWIFQCFQGIHLVRIKSSETIVNVNKKREEILKYLPNECQKYY